MTRYPLRDRIAVTAALAAPLLVSLLLVPFRGSLSSTNMALILVVVVVAVAAAGNRVAGALTALSAAAWFDFFLTRPYQSFTINRADDVETTVLLLAVGVAVSQLAARARARCSSSPTPSTWPGFMTPPSWLSPRQLPTRSSTTSSSSSPNCCSCVAAGSNTAPCSAARPAWSRTAA